MERQKLIQKSRELMHNSYCNGVTIDYDKILESSNQIKVYLDFQIPKRVEDNGVEHIFFMKLSDVGLIALSKDGKLLQKSAPEDLVQETIEKYKELIEKREKFIIKLFADKLIKVGQIRLALTPLRKVLRRFLENDFRTDNLTKNFEDNEIKYIKFLSSFDYLRKEGEKYTLHNEYIKRLEPQIEEENREEQIESIIASIFANHFNYIVTELGTTSIVPFIGILTSLCNLTLELQKNIHLSVEALLKLYKEHYTSGQDVYKIEDKVIDMYNAEVLVYDENSKQVTLPQNLFQNLMERFKTEFKQTQIS